MLAIVRFLQSATASRFLNGVLHRLGNFVSVQNHFRIFVSSRSTDRLHQRRFTSQKTLFVSI